MGSMDVALPPLARAGGDEPAGLWIASLPWPREADELGKPAALALDGRPTYARSIGRWPNGNAPRRVLMIADGGDAAPDALTVTNAANDAPAPPPTADAELFQQSDDPYFMWERRQLRIRHGERSVALAMGLRTAGEVHWWEATRLVVLEETPTCRVVEMAGAIPHVLNDRQTLKDHPGLTHPWLHNHNWLYGQIYARLHANGVCEIFAHHVNSKYFDEGSDLNYAVPVIGIAIDDDAARRDARALEGEWAGDTRTLTLGHTRFDVTDAAHLATPGQPGRFGIDDDSSRELLVWQPYQGCELFGGRCPTELTGDPHIYRAEQRIIPRGMARSVRFSLSLSADRSPRVARYLAPSWWYGLCAEFHPEPLLLVSIADWDAKLASGQRYVEQTTVQGGFEDGCAARGGKPDKRDRLEPSWEGELPHAQFLWAWRTGDGAAHDLALRTAYYFTDVSVDHAAKLVRMHGYPPIAFALPMARMQASIAAYLETGDPYLLETAEAVTEASYRLHRNAWPRMAVGRDAMAGRAAAMLYRYFANEHFAEMARQVALAVVESQRDNGSFGDQGGGSGIHQYSGYVTKPWMGLMATNIVLDVLELMPEDPQADRWADCVRRFADWLMAERVDRDGVRSWAYQHDYNGQRVWEAPVDRQEMPTPGRWHHETLARLLGWCAMRFDRPDYLDAWAESAAAHETLAGDHPVATAMQFLPWLADRLWRATPAGEGRIAVRPYHFGPRTPDAARVLGPAGPIELRWSPAGEPVLGENVELAQPAHADATAAPTGLVT